MTSNENLFLIERFLEMLSAERLASINTLISYKNDLNHFIDYLLQCNLPISNLSEQSLNDYISSLSQRDLASRSIARKVSTLRQFFAFLVEESVIMHNPSLEVESPKQGLFLPKALTQAQLLKLLEVAHKDTSFEGMRNVAILEILYATGMRISELIQLKLSSIQTNLSSAPDFCVIIIKGKGNKERVALLNKSALSAIRNYLPLREGWLKKRKSDYLFPSFTKDGKGTHITRQRFFQIIKRLAVQAGVDIKLVSPHKIRHSFASHLLENGADLRVVQDLLGHADISSTQIYTKILNNKKKEVVFKYHPLQTN